MQFDRPFCSTCGSPVATPVPALGLVFAPAGGSEGDPGIRPQGHIFAGSKASWYEITDALPQYDGISRKLHQGSCRTGAGKADA